VQNCVKGLYALCIVHMNLIGKIELYDVSIVNSVGNLAVRVRAMLKCYLHYFCREHNLQPLLTRHNLSRSVCGRSGDVTSRMYACVLS
jgi:hypothetical protein